MGEEYIIVARLCDVEDSELREALQMLNSLGTGDSQVVVVPDDLRRQALAILEEI